MADLSTDGANRFLTWMMTNSAVARPSSIHAALFTAPTTEVSGFGYARQTITFSNGSNRGTSNTNEPEFTASGGNFGNITHIGLFDAATNGSMLWQGPLVGGSKLIENGDVLVIKNGSVTIGVN